MGPIERTIRRALAARLKRESRYRVAKANRRELSGHFRFPR